MSKAVAIAVLWLLAIGFCPLVAADPTSGVSSDLQAIYARTQTATKEADYTEIARDCSKIIPDPKRPESDKSYAKRLFAWALNRRGEVRSEAAAQLVREEKYQEAQLLDQQAGKDFATAVKYAPDNWRIHHNLAISQAMQGKYPEAIAAFTQVLALKNDYPNAFYNRAELYFEQEKFAESIRDYSQAIELAPGDASYYNGRAHARFMLNEIESAVADYSRAVELDATNAAYLTDLADAFQSTGQWEQAATRYRQAVAVDKKYARAYRNVAWLLATCPEKRFRNPNLAVSAAQKAIELAGDKDYRSLDTLAAATAATGDSTKAAELVRQALALAPENVREEITERAQVYDQGGSFVQSKPQLELNPIGVAPSEVRTASAADAPKKR
jgi:tetratricopeptide (TPR) repeat protein